MKKDYMKPEGKIVAMSIQENIASSESTTGDTYGIHYTIGVDGTRFIQGSDVAATNTGNAKFDRFYDLVKTYLYPEKNLANCRFDV